MIKKITIDEHDAAWMRKFENRLEVALYVAYMEARTGGKRKTYDEHNFEVNDFENLWILKQDMLNKTYAPSRSTAHIIYNPVIREIFAAPFRDRVAHHLIFDAVYNWWDKRFITDSYSCRLKKGTLYGIQRLDHHIRSASLNYARRVWILKMDLSGYFMNLPRMELYQRAIWGLDQQFKGRKNVPEYELLKFLWYQTIMDDPVKGVKKKGRLDAWDDLPPSKSLFHQAPGKGIVIGNLTSQLLSNIYLDRLDRFIVYDLGYKHYGRYVDDFYIVVTEDELPQLKRDITSIRNFLMGLQLKVNEQKTRLQPIERGVEFLGGVIYKDRIVPGKRLVKNMMSAFVEVTEGQRSLETIVSYLGHAKHLDSRTLIRRALEGAGQIPEI